LNNPRLVATSGYLKGTAWPAKDGPLSLGRDACNQIVVSDAAVSRKHCAVREVASGVFEVADPDSHNETLLNGTKVSRKAIRVWHPYGFPPLLRIWSSATQRSTPRRMRLPSCIPPFWCGREELQLLAATFALLPGPTHLSATGAWYSPGSGTRMSTSRGSMGRSGDPSRR
jgi:hypothetical protein